MGDSCCASWSIGSLKHLIEDKLGVFVHSIDTGSGSTSSDVWSSFFGNVNDQVDRVCKELQGMPELQGGYNAVGFSQGGQFLRAVVERCQHLGPRCHSLVTLGSQHQGVMNVPDCGTLPDNSTADAAAVAGLVAALDLAAARGSGRSGRALRAGAAGAQEGHAAGGAGGEESNSQTACQAMQAMLDRGAYLPYIRDHVVQAQYFKDPARIDQYLKYNTFLPDINNELEEARSPQYRRNLASLSRLVLYRFSDDRTVVPRDSAWFSVVEGSELKALRDQAIYREDWIGLKELDKRGRLDMLEAPGQHMQFTLDWFEHEVVDKLLSRAAAETAAGHLAAAAEQAAGLAVEQ